MKNSFFHIKVLLKQLVVLLFIYGLCRFFFYLFNTTYFNDISFGQLILYCFYGIKFDLSVITITNSLWIFLKLAPTPFRDKKAYRFVLNFLFYAVNSIAVLANCIDMVYFKFILKRSTSDVFDLISTGSDFAALLPTFISDYWYMLSLWVSLIVLMIFLHKKADKKVKNTEENPKINYLAECILFILSIGFFLLAYRGGTQLKPISIINAGEYTSAKNIPLIINSPFSIIKTVEATAIKEKTYFSERELVKIYNPIQQFNRQKPGPINIVIIIMESFSKEYIGALNDGKGYTPFLDSLISQSLVFDNAFANGKKSMEGIPAVTAGIPALMREPFITSHYGANHITSLASTLRKEGYTCAFYHGGTNGTMGFDSFTKLAGFEDYYGRKEYDNDEDYDGSWGIWDEPFFQYFAKQLEKEKQPFLNVFFSLSSHHPYKVPTKYGLIFEDGPLPIHKSIRYADYSLAKFFETASSMPWYKNTLFVITADHTGDAGSDIAANRVGMYRVPLIFYTPYSNKGLIRHEVVQQIDILPSILDYLGYGEPFFGFGKSIFDTHSNRFAVNYINETYQIIDDIYALQFDGERSLSLYNYKNDITLTQNMLDTDTINKKRLELQLKAVIQTFNTSLIHNKMKAE